MVLSYVFKHINQSICIIIIILIIHISLDICSKEVMKQNLILKIICSIVHREGDLSSLEERREEKVGSELSCFLFFRI